MNIAALRDKAATAYWLMRAQGFFWHLPDRTSPEDLQDFRCRARRLLHRRWPWFVRPIIAILSAFVWPIASWREAGALSGISDTNVHPPNLRKLAWHAALRHNVNPSEYGSYAMWRENAAPPDSYGFRTEISFLNARLMDRTVIDLAGDKVAFAEFCSRNGELAVPPTLALFRNGHAEAPFTDHAPPPHDLAIKPVRASHARGFEAWRFTDGAYRCVAATTAKDARSPMDADALLNHLAQSSRSEAGGLLVQPLLAPHATLSHLDCPGPPVVRIITGRWRDGKCELLDAILHKPAPTEFLFTAGSMRLIDVGTGRTHPMPGGPHPFARLTADPALDDIALPGWPDCLGELPKLHAALPGTAPLLGWDVIFAPDGPVILEANTTIAPYHFQVAGMAPAADGNWARLLAGYLP